MGATHFVMAPRPAFIENALLKIVGEIVQELAHVGAELPGRVTSAVMVLIHGIDIYCYRKTTFLSI